MHAKLVATLLAATVLFVGALAWADTAKGPEALLTDAEAASNKLEVEKAVALYTEAIESGRLSAAQLAAAYFGRGKARDDYAEGYGIKDSELVLALRDYRKSRELVATAAVYLREGGVFLALGAYTEAAAQYRSAGRLESPEPHWSLIGLARTARTQKQYDAAIAHLDEALRIIPDGTMPIFYHRGRTLYLQEKYAAAVESLTKGLAHQPDYAYATMYRACANARAGNTADALKDIETAIAVVKQSPVDEVWQKTPAAQAAQQEMARDLAIIKAMNGSGASDAERSKLCTSTWDAGETLRERSPLLSIDDRQFVSVTLSHPRTSPSEKAGRRCKSACDGP